MGTERLHGLDALRSLAALVVFWSHLVGEYGLDLPRFGAHHAVNFFFVLSGFVLARAFEPRFREGLKPLKFMRLRYRRLWPPLVAGVALGLVAATIAGKSGPASLMDALPLLLFMPAIWRADVFELNTPIWSLHVEIVCNALHALIFARLDNRGLAVTAGLAGTLFMIGQALSGHQQFPVTAGDVPALICRGVLFYAIGILLARGATLKSIFSHPGPQLATAIFAVSIAACAVSPLAYTAGVILAPVVVLLASRVRTSRTLFILGTISFPLYAIHSPLTRLLHDLGVSPVQAAGIVLLSAALIAMAFEMQRVSTQAGNAVPLQQ